MPVHWYPVSAKQQARARVQRGREVMGPKCCDRENLFSAVAFGPKDAHIGEGPVVLIVIKAIPHHKFIWALHHQGVTSQAQAPPLKIDRSGLPDSDTRKQLNPEAQWFSSSFRNAYLAWGLDVHDRLPSKIYV